MRLKPRPYVADTFAYATKDAKVIIDTSILSLDAYQEELARRAAARWDDQLREQMRQAYGGPPPVEIITDPGDRRGFDARPVGPA